MFNNIIFLAQTDTTAGFLSKNKELIIKTKKSNLDKKILMEVDSIKELKQYTRIPKEFCKHIRRKNKSTFIFKNMKSFRIVRDNLHIKFLSRFKSLYSSSANISNKKFSSDMAYNLADIIVIDNRNIYDSKPSSIFKIRANNIKKIR